MIVAPGTRVRFLRNVPLDNTYEHTIYFDTAALQTAYFETLTKYSYNDFTYQRVTTNVIRVGRKADDLYDCNYIMFQNTNFGNKWFYAFITGIEYINNECSNVTFELDVMQTWLFDYQFAETFVEREHSVTDRIGENIVPENVDVGEYVFNFYRAVNDGLADMVVAIAIVDVDNPDGKLYDGIYGGSTLYVYDSTDSDGINAKLAEYTQKPDAVVAMYMFPKLLIMTIPDNHVLRPQSSGWYTKATYGAMGETETLDGYVPKNKKLYTYPYNYFHVDNASGQSLSLRYEFFQNGQPCIIYGGTVTQPVQIVCRPAQYKGTITDYTLNTEMISLTGYPICSWNYDAYQTWIAQNAIPIAINTASNLGSALMGGISRGKPVSAVAGSAVHAVSDIVSQFYTASIAADINRGSLNNGSPDIATRKHQFYVGRCSVNSQSARIIDNYFDMYGYATHILKKPNRNSRPHWNYVKTVSCNIHGSIPADDMSKICRIYDTGVTFWKNGSEVGDYSLDNTV